MEHSLTVIKIISLVHGKEQTECHIFKVFFFSVEILLITVYFLLCFIFRSCVSTLSLANRHLKETSVECMIERQMVLCYIFTENLSPQLLSHSRYEKSQKYPSNEYLKTKKSWFLKFSSSVLSYIHFTRWNSVPALCFIIYLHLLCIDSMTYDCVWTGTGINTAQPSPSKQQVLIFSYSSQTAIFNILNGKSYW